VKFKDADLIGIPFRVTVGPKALARGAVELKARRDSEVRELPLADAVAALTALVREGLQA
jgi:prolyl-tRNA synthetase